MFPPLTTAGQRGNHTFNLESGRGLASSRVAAVLPGIGVVQVANDQRVHLPLVLDAALVAGADHGRALLPLHGGVRLGHLAGQVGSATLLQLQVVQLLHEGAWGSCGERRTALLQQPHPASPPGQSWVCVVTFGTRLKRNEQRKVLAWAIFQKSFYIS